MQMLSLSTSCYPRISMTNHARTNHPSVRLSTVYPYTLTLPTPMDVEPRSCARTGSLWGPPSSMQVNLIIIPTDPPRQVRSRALLKPGRCEVRRFLSSQSCSDGHSAPMLPDVSDFGTPETPRPRHGDGPGASSMEHQSREIDLLYCLQSVHSFLFLFLSPCPPPPPRADSGGGR